MDWAKSVLRVASHVSLLPYRIARVLFRSSPLPDERLCILHSALESAVFIFNVLLRAFITTQVYFSVQMSQNLSKRDNGSLQVGQKGWCVCGRAKRLVDSLINFSYDQMFRLILSHFHVFYFLPFFLTWFRIFMLEYW